MRIPENLSSAFQLQLQQTTVYIPERSTVEAEIDSTLTARMADTEAEVQNVLEIVEEELNAGGQLIGSSNVYSYYATDTITRLDDIAFFFFFYHRKFTGGVHCNNWQTAINFSLKNASEFTSGRERFCPGLRHPGRARRCGFSRNRGSGCCNPAGPP